MASDSSKYNIDTPPEIILEEFKKEFDTFQKPECNTNDLDSAGIDDIVKDIHKAIYGNGGATKGIIWKLAEYNVRVIDTAGKQDKCRVQVVKHMQESDDAVMRYDAGIVGICKRYPKLVAVVAIVMIFGITSLWSLIIEQRQAAKWEQFLLSVGKIPIVQKDTSK